MPETPVDKNRYTGPNEHDVRSPRQISPMQAISKPYAV